MCAPTHIRRTQTAYELRGPVHACTHVRILAAAAEYNSGNTMELGQSCFDARLRSFHLLRRASFGHVFAPTVLEVGVSLSDKNVRSSPLTKVGLGEEFSPSSLVWPKRYRIPCGAFQMSLRETERYCASIRWMLIFILFTDAFLKLITFFFFIIIVIFLFWSLC